MYAPLLGVHEQAAEAAVAVGRLVERGLLALHGVLDHRGEDRVLVLADEGARSTPAAGRRPPSCPAGCRPPAGRARPAAGLLLQVLVEDELVAVAGQQVGGRVLHAEADDVLAVLLELGDQGREVGVARTRSRRCRCAPWTRPGPSRPRPAGCRRSSCRSSAAGGSRSARWRSRAAAWCTACTRPSRRRPS